MQNTTKTVREVLASKMNRFVHIVEGLVEPNDTRSVKERSELIDLHTWDLRTQVRFASECECITFNEYDRICSKADRVWSWAQNLLHNARKESRLDQMRSSKYAQACGDIKWQAELLQNDHAPQALNQRRKTLFHGFTTTA